MVGTHDLAAALSPRPELAFFDQMIFSVQIGAVEPDREAFEAAIARIGTPRHEMLFIDDRPASVEGAKAAGMQATLFTSVDVLRDELAA